MGDSRLPGGWLLWSLPIRLACAAVVLLLVLGNPMALLAAVSMPAAGALFHLGVRGFCSAGYLLGGRQVTGRLARLLGTLAIAVGVAVLRVSVLLFSRA